MRNLILYILISLLIFSCKKEKISEDHPELIGNWTQQTDEELYKKLYIKDKSKGTLYECSSAPGGDCADSEFRKWRIKDNQLFYGLSNNLGEITQYPTIAASDILFGTNDTIKSGERYMALNYSYYVDITN